MKKEIHPFDEYLLAEKELQNGNKEKAAVLLSSCFGIGKVTEPIRNNIDRILDMGTNAHKIFLPLLVHECKRRS